MNERLWRWKLVALLPCLLLTGTPALAWKRPFAGPNCPPPLPKQTVASPNGAHVSEFVRVQQNKAEADDFTIYLHEWFKGGQSLGPYGRYHLNLITKRLPEVPFPVVVQPDPDCEEALNEARRMCIVNHLLAAGFAEAPIRVVLGWPQGEGLYGDEAPRIYDLLIQGSQQNQFGTPFGGFGGGFGSGFGGAFGGGTGGFFGGFSPFGGGYR